MTEAQHPSFFTLDRLAVGDVVPGEVVVHVDACPLCRAHVAEVRGGDEGPEPLGVQAPNDRPPGPDDAMALPFHALSAVVQKSAHPSAPRKLRLMAARGLAPMPPRDLVTAQFVLTFDADEGVATEAAARLGEVDERIARTVLGDVDVPPPVLAHLARSLATQDAFVQMLLLNPTTPSEAFVDVAKVCSEQIGEMIADHQARLLEAPDIARSLDANPNALKSTRDRVFDFLVRNQKFLEGVRAFEEALLCLNGDERMKAADVSGVPLRFLDEGVQQDERARRQIAEDDALGEEEDEDQPLEVLIRGMNAAQKVALATKGNRQARRRLMADTHRLVALAAITSPCMTEAEVLAAANSRTVNTDVIVHICRDKKNNWVRKYDIKLAIVQNPQTPLPEAMKLVPTLNARDVKQLAKNRNVPAGVRNMSRSRPPNSGAHAEANEDPKIRRDFMDMGRSQTEGRVLGGKTSVEHPPSIAGVARDEEGHIRRRKERTPIYARIEKALTKAGLAEADDPRDSALVEDLKARTVEQEVEPILGRGSHYENLTDWAEAIERFEQAVRLAPEHGPARIRLAHALIRGHHSPDVALVHAQKAVQKLDKEPEAHFVLALCYDGCGQGDAAVRALKKALELKPNYKEAKKLLRRLQWGF